MAACQPVVSVVPCSDPLSSLESTLLICRFASPLSHQSTHRYHHRVLYIDIDVHHGDGVEEAFTTTGKLAGSDGGGQTSS